MFQNLTIEPTQGDRILILTEKTWADYEKLIQEKSNYRISYLNNVINIVSPSRNHERIAATISILINAYCRKYQIPYFALGTQDIKKQFVTGKQPDASYCFETEKDVPDLAIEVNAKSEAFLVVEDDDLTHSRLPSGSINDLEKYKLLGVSEVWIWQDNMTTFYHLKNGEYFSQLRSQNLYNHSSRLKLALDSDFLDQFVNRGLTEDNLTIETDFFNSFL